jgi:hypothetical protein
MHKPLREVDLETVPGFCFELCPKITSTQVNVGKRRFPTFDMSSEGFGSGESKLNAYSTHWVAKHDLKHYSVHL